MIKTAVVTGGTGDIGSAVVSMLLEKGYAVCASYFSDEAKAAELAAAHENMPLHLIKADVSDFAETEALYNKADKLLGGIGVSVHCAGVDKSALLAMTASKDWDKVIAINLTGTYNCCKCAVRKMIPNKFGRIINISSAAARMPRAGQAAYAASKAGVNALTKALAQETAAFGITVNAVAPGYVKGSMADKYYEKTVKDIPLRRFACPEEAAEVVCFLAGENAGYITGSVYAVDGGLGT